MADAFGRRNTIGGSEAPALAELDIDTGVLKRNRVLLMNVPEGQFYLGYGRREMLREQLIDAETFLKAFNRYRNGNLIAFDRDLIVRTLGAAAVMNGENPVGIHFSDMDRSEIYGADSEQFE